MTLSIAFHGAAATVTGSCIELVGSKGRILVDCGMFQGSRSLEALNFRPFPFAPGRIDAVILTHAHIDHCGLLPRLAAHRYEGPIYCTQPTADLLKFMLADAGRIQESEARRRNRRRDRADSPPIAPIYTEADAIAAWRLSRPVKLEEWFEPTPGFRARLWNAGHILGSASVELEVDGVRVLCSGDLGPDNKAFHASPGGPSGFDHVLCESTYGDRRREAVSIEQRRALLAAEIGTALSAGGNLIIPAFALERTQELLLDIACLLRERRIAPATVFVDSPLANGVTRVFAQYADDLEDTGGRSPFEHPAIHYVEDTAASIRLNSVLGAIIIAASGMCEGGRIRHHLIHNLHRSESTVLFVGYQAQGSLGRVILDGARRVRISGQDVSVRARIRRIDSYSAHADQHELLAWLAARGPIGGSLFLGHGEEMALETLKNLAAPTLRHTPLVPQIGEHYELRAGKPAKRTRTGLPDLRGAIGRDWQNDYAQLASSLKHRLEAIDGDEARRLAIREIEQLLGKLSTSTRAPRAA
jgi:metallo-beta-lactamase family protein